MPHKKAKTDRSEKQKLPVVSKKLGVQAIELKGRDIFQVEDVLTAQECEGFIQTAEALGFQHQGSQGAAFGEAYRSNGRTALQSKQLADLLWKNTGLDAIFKEYTIGRTSALGLNSNIRFYRYVAGDRFGKHVDDSVEIGRNKTMYTLLIYLSGDKLVGGETRFYGGRQSRLVASIKPLPGLALLHLHGDDCLEHEGAPVVKGTKYVLRSDVIYG